MGNTYNQSGPLGPRIEIMNTTTKDTSQPAGRSEREYLVVYGPPGSGKTLNAAAMCAALGYDFRCATFNPAMKAAIPPAIRAKMDADRERAQRRKPVWLLEAPAIPGYYLRATPRITGKLGTQTEMGTSTPQEAMQFPRRRTAEEYMRQNPVPAWTPTEHIFDS